jgi:hypothetical protein
VHHNRCEAIAGHLSSTVVVVVSMRCNSVNLG